MKKWIIEDNKLEGIVKGDTIELKFVCLETENITGWKIRCEIWDETEDIKKATANSGGSDDQILITDTDNGKFTVNIDKAETTDFADETNIEIEVEDGNGKVFTIYQNTIKFINEQVDWTTP